MDRGALSITLHNSGLSILDGRVSKWNVASSSPIDPANRGVYHSNLLELTRAVWAIGLNI